MRYKDLIEAPNKLSYEDQIKPWAIQYAKEANIHPRFALALFDQESRASTGYIGVGDEDWAKENHPDNWEHHLGRGPGHFSIRALPDLKDKYPKDPQIQSADWTTLRDNPQAAARFAVLHLANLAKKNDGNFHTAYKLYRGNPNIKGANKVANQFISHVQRQDPEWVDPNPVTIAKASTDQGWLSRWADARKKEWEDGWSDEDKKEWLAGQEKIKQKGEEFYRKLTDPDEWKQMAKNAWDKTVDPEQWKQTVDTILGNEPESDFMRKAREKALAKKTASQSSKVAGPKTPRSIKPSNTEPLSTQPSNTNESKTFKEYLEEANSKYIVSMNPNDKKWYVMGHVGNNKWMPVSNGFKNKAQAQKWAKSQDKVDIAARGEISGA
jgi:hypothetical protein